MDKQSIIIGVVGVLIVGVLAIFLVSSTNKNEPVVELKKSNELSLEEPVKDKTITESGTEQNKEIDISKTMTQPKQPAMQIDSSKTYTATLNTTAGSVKILFYADKTPITVNNFVSLARKGFYDGTIFHRTIAGFMIQGGDPEGTGRGGPGYKFDDEPFEGKYDRGIVAMANAGPNTNGSQFFIMQKDYDLPPNYVIFGKVTEGLDVVDKIAEAPTLSGGEGSTPVNPVTIESVEIAEE